MFVIETKHMNDAEYKTYTHAEDQDTAAQIVDDVSNGNPMLYARYRPLNRIWREGNKHVFYVTRIAEDEWYASPRMSIVGAFVTHPRIVSNDPDSFSVYITASTAKEAIAVAISLHSK